MRSVLRPIAALSLAATLLAGAWLGASSPAGAMSQEAIKLTSPSEVNREYGALVGNEPAETSGNDGLVQPDKCATVTYCDVIPVELSVPADLKSSDTEDYFLRLTVGWDNAGGNNLSMFLYNSPYDGPGGDAPIARSVTANQPEAITLYRPEGAKYLLLVNNNTGLNTGYKLKAAITVEPFGGAPDFGVTDTTRPPPPPPDDDDSGSDDDFSADFGDEIAPVPSDPEPSGPAPTLPLADVDRDDALARLGSRRGGFDDQLSAPPTVAINAAADGPPPGPVSGVALVLLGFVAPFAALGGGIYWLRRKGGAASIAGL